MDEWKPDYEFIEQLRLYWSNEHILDEPYALPLMEHSIGSIVAMYEQEHFPDSLELSDYFKRNFPLDEPLCDHHLTGAEYIEGMKTGTPSGIFLYSTLYMHKDCCFPASGKQTTNEHKHF